MTGSDVLYLFVAFCQVVGTIGGAVFVVRKLSGKPERREVSNDRLLVREDPPTATKPELEILRHGTEQRSNELRDQMGRLEQGMREDIQRIHERIDDLPSQIITILRNTGALK